LLLNFNLRLFLLRVKKNVVLRDLLRFKKHTFYRRQNAVFRLNSYGENNFFRVRFAELQR
jgi:hypothetical protein